MKDAQRQPDKVLLEPGASGAGIPIWLAPMTGWKGHLAHLPREQLGWLDANGFDGMPRRHVLLPGAGGTVAGVVLGIGDRHRCQSGHLDGDAGRRAGAGAAGRHLSPRRSGRVRSDHGGDRLGPRRLPLPPLQGQGRFASGGAGDPRSADARHVMASVEATWLGRDLINTPANDMGPAELELAARDLAARHGAKVDVIVGDDLIEKNFPLIHAVGRASTRAPRLIDLTWGRADAVKVTVVGKGICFDTGGLDIKPSSGMLLMKKDMGGAASALALGHMIMSAGLDVRLRVLIPAAENAIGGNAFRPSDVIRARSGATVEIGNTDAEGRLVLADALSLADEEAPDHLFTFATLTGAARVALGPICRPISATTRAWPTRSTRRASRSPIRSGACR